MSIVLRENWPNGNPKSEEYFSHGSIYRKHGPAVTKWYENGQKQLEKYTTCGAVKDEKQIRSLGWHQSGQIKHIKYFAVKQIGLRESYYENGDPKTKVIRDGEYFIKRKWYDNRQIRLEIYCDTYGSYIRHDGPARLTWARNGQLTSEAYYNSAGRRYYIHREWNQNGQILEEIIRDTTTYDIIHKRTWNQNGQIILDATKHTEKEWYQNGTPKIDFEIFDEMKIISEYREDGSLQKRTWYIDATEQIHNCFGPAIIKVSPDGIIKKEYRILDRFYSKDAYKMAVKPPSIRILFQTILPPPVAEEIWHYFRVVV